MVKELIENSIDAEATQITSVLEQAGKKLIQVIDNGLGISVEPTGAFYVLANARHIDGDSYRLAFDILEKAGVAVTPGIDFGRNAEGYLRFSYASSLEKISEAMNRLEKYLAERSA